MTPHPPDSSSAKEPSNGWQETGRTWLRRWQATRRGWWLVIAGPALASLASAPGHSGPRRVGLVLSLGSLAAMVDIGLRPAVPGANDNLTGVAALIALARALQREPVRGLR